MKKLISLLLALLFVFGTVTVANADGEVFEGIVTDETAETVTVTNAFGTVLTFALSGAPEIAPVGSGVTVAFSGDITTQLVAEDLAINSEAVVSGLLGTVVSVEDGKFSAQLEDGSTVEFKLTGVTAIAGKANTLEEGQNVTVTFADTAFGPVATGIEINELPKVKETVEAVVNDTHNKTLSGTVSKLTDSKITIKTKKGKTWSFKINRKTKYSGKYDLKVGCTVTITYDGYASKTPAAKRIKITKAAPDKQYKKKSGVCEYFEGMAIGIKGGFHADVAYAKHTGKGYRGPGTKVTVTYYTKNGENYAVKINWKK